MEQIIVFMRNGESAFSKKGMFCDGKLRTEVLWETLMEVKASVFVVVQPP